MGCSPTNYGADWLKHGAPDGDVVISSRIRLARNFAGFPFVCRASADDRRQILHLARRDIMEGGFDDQMIWVDLNDLTLLERSVLVERHLISKQHAKGSDPRAAAISSPEERLSIMVNEEDHLRIQVLRGGLALSSAFDQINDVDDQIATLTGFAYNPRFGYLTACPTNVGTGIRVSVMLHLPGLKLSGEIDKVRRAARGMSLAVRGYYGEGSEAVGDFFQISNQTTLGKSEHEILHNFEDNIIPKIIEYERLARRSLLDKRRTVIEDKIYRALGMLRHARLLKADEALEKLSFVRLGAVMDVIDDLDVDRVNQLILLTQPAHLQKVLSRDLDQSERRVERATLVREHLGGS